MRITSALMLVVPMGLAIAQQPSSATKKAFTPADWYKVTTVGSPVLSPDGKQVAFTVTTVRESENKRHTEIWMVPTQGGSPMRMTSPSTESANPRFSDDGKVLYFTSQRPGVRGTTWALRMDQPGEAFQPDRPPQFQQGVQPADKSFTIITEGDGGNAFGGRGGGRGGNPFADSTTAPDSARANDPYGRMQPMAPSLRPTAVRVCGANRRRGPPCACRRRRTRSSRRESARRPRASCSGSGDTPP